MNLPHEAQYSCTNDILAKDLNRDGFQDLILVGNSHNFLPQFGKLDANHGVVLINQDGKSFNYNHTFSREMKLKGVVNEVGVFRSNTGNELIIFRVNNAKPTVLELLKPLQ